MNIKIFAATVLGIAVLILALLLWGGITEGGLVNDDRTATSTDQIATSTDSTTDTSGPGNDTGDAGHPQDSNETTDWSQYGGVDTYKYEHVGLGYTFQAPVLWGYFDLDEDERPMNAWFFLTDERELQAVDREALMASTDARLRIITVSKLPIGGEDRARTMEAVTGHTITPNFEPTGPSVEAIRQGYFSTPSEETNGVAFSFLMKEKNRGFVEVEAIYKTEEGRKKIEEFVYSLANTFDR